MHTNIVQRGQQGGIACKRGFAGWWMQCHHESDILTSACLDKKLNPWFMASISHSLPSALALWMCKENPYSALKWVHKKSAWTPCPCSVKGKEKFMESYASLRSLTSFDKTILRLKMGEYWASSNKPLLVCLPRTSTNHPLHHNLTIPIRRHP